MPRTARIKSKDAMYHIMSRSFSEVNLFKSCEDKEFYLKILKKYSSMHHCSIYAYCLMDNHVHIYINPKGFDISTFMHCLNTSYVCYYNKKYNRHGHLFQGRFASRIVDSDKYSLTLSAYIHNNAKDIKEYNGREEEYPYSSYGIYIGKRKDKYKLIDKSFILGHFSKDIREAHQNYLQFVKIMKSTNYDTEINEQIIKVFTQNEYRNEKKYIERDIKPDYVVKKVCELLDESSTNSIEYKYNRKKTKIRALVIYGIRVLCGYTYKKIGEYIGDLSLSGVIRLSNKGYDICNNNHFIQKVLIG